MRFGLTVVGSTLGGVKYILDSHLSTSEKQIALHVRSAEKQATSHEKQTALTIESIRNEISSNRSTREKQIAVIGKQISIMDKRLDAFENSMIQMNDNLERVLGKR